MREGIMGRMESTERKSKIMVVDDEPMVCRSVEKILNRKGHEVAKALCVSEALDSLEAGATYDLIIADLMMPHVGGIELLKIVRERWPKTPVLIVTGYASIASAVEATRFGAVGYLPKPFTPDELEQAVERFRAAETGHSESQGLPESGAIDVDLPFDAGEVARATSPRYVDSLTRSDVAAVSHKPLPAPDYCFKGNRACKRMLKQGVCQQAECPQITAERKKAARAGKVVPLVADPIDVDMPFSYSEVASITGEAYANALGRSDMPIAGFWGSERSTLKAPKVLVVDDEAVVVNSIRKTLARRAYCIEEAFSGEEAMSRISTENYDLVLLDMRLPDANGLDLIEGMKQQKPNLQVVVVTGYASIDTAVEAIQRGANDYIAKPFTPEELYATTSRALKQAVA
jgi:CheY-like chemotaxis protein